MAGNVYLSQRDNKGPRGGVVQPWWYVPPVPSDLGKSQYRVVKRADEIMIPRAKIVAKSEFLGRVVSEADISLLSSFLMTPETRRWVTKVVQKERILIFLLESTQVAIVREPNVGRDSECSLDSAGDLAVLSTLHC